MKFTDFHKGCILRVHSVFFSRKMAQIHNQIGALSDLKAKLRSKGVYDFDSLQNILDFLKQFPQKRNQIILKHSEKIKSEKDELSRNIFEIVELIEKKKNQKREELIEHIQLIEKDILEYKIARGQLWLKVKSRLLSFGSSIKLLFLKSVLETRVKRIVFDENIKLDNWRKRLGFLEGNFHEAVNLSANETLAPLVRKFDALKELKPLVLGAIGERQVLDQLRLLPSNFHVINDFYTSFRKAIYRKEQDDYIQTIQIDHIVIGPSGVFVIETKNWNQHTIIEQNHWGPIEQVRRAGYVIFVLLNSDDGNIFRSIKKSLWSQKKIAVRSILAMTNERLSGEFKYVKVLKPNDLLSYIQYFKNQLTLEEVDQIVSRLLKY